MRIKGHLSVDQLTPRALFSRIIYFKGSHHSMSLLTSDKFKWFDSY